VASTPLSTGDIVGRSFRIFRQNILLIGKSLLLPTIIICLGRISVLVGISYSVKFVSNPGAGLLWIVLAIVGGTVVLVGAAMLWIKQLVLVRYLTGFDPNFQDAQEFVKGRLWSLVALFIATTAAAIGVLIFWSVVMVPSFLALKGQDFWPVVGSFGLAISILGLIFSVIFISLVYNLVSIALALDKGELGNLIGEGFNLTARSFFRSSFFLIMTITSVTLVAYPLSLPMILLIGGYFIAQGAALGTTSPEAAMPMFIQVFNSVWETGVNMIIGPIYYLAYALYYRDLRMRQEGLDLIERLDDVEKADNSGRLSRHGI
jgi:hypothetical protein